MQAKIKTRYRRLKFVVSFIFLVAFSAALYWYLFASTSISCDDAYVSGNIIPVQALVPGIVVKVNVDNSMLVHTNQLLLKQEQHLMQEHMMKASASLAEAVRKTRSQFSEVDQVKGEILTLHTQQAKLKEDLTRYLQAELGGAVSSQKVSDTRADIDIVDNQMIAAEAKLQTIQALVFKTTIQNNPIVEKEKAEFIENFVQYQRASVTSPIDGYVANRRVQAGQQVVAGQLLMNIIPLNDLWITANIKETNMKRVLPGQTVVVSAHIYGRDITYHGQVIGIEPAGGSTFSLFPADNATGNYIHIVERVPVRISLRPSELSKYPLRPGMSVTVDINTKGALNHNPLDSKVTADTSSYATNIYERELKEASLAAVRIIQAN